MRDLWRAAGWGARGGGWGGGVGPGGAANRGGAASGGGGRAAGAVGRIKQRERGFGAGEPLTGIAAAQLAGEDFLAGLDRQRADAAGQQITPVPGLASTTAAGLARRLTPGQWRAVETGPSRGHR